MVAASQNQPQIADANNPRANQPQRTTAAGDPRSRFSALPPNSPQAFNNTIDSYKRR